MRARVLLIVIAVVCLVAPGVHADITLNQEHSFAARAGATVVIDVSFHEVEVTARPGETIDVVVNLKVGGSGNKAKKVMNDLQPKFLEQGNKIIIRSTRKNGFHWSSLKTKGKVTVQMPPDMNLTIDSSSGSALISGDFGDAKVSFDASSGSIRVVGAMHELHTDTSSGSVHAEVMCPVHLFTADASSGSVRLTGGAHEARVDTSSGSINLANLRGNASLDASSGSITAHWDAIPAGAKVRADASSGGVTLRFPSGTTLSGTVDTSSGRISSDFPGTSSRSHLVLNGAAGAVNVKVDTSSGGVRLISE